MFSAERKDLGGLVRKAALFIFCVAALALTINGNVMRSGPGSLCTADEQVIFTCILRRPQKIVSLCGAKDLSKTRGYLQYRFGLPGKIELEFPKQQQGTQQAFRYKHYFRAQVDLTEISFSLNDYDYSVFDDYNGEEKPAVSQQGVRVTPSAGGKEVTLVCREKAKANFSDLQDILPNEPE